MSKPRIHVLALGGTIATRPDARALGVMAVMLDEVYAAADVIKAHPTRLNSFAAPQAGPLAALVEDRVVPLGLPVAMQSKQRAASSGRRPASSSQWRCCRWDSTSPVISSRRC
jgi:L-asparaginase/Glu-tRNA(Gln) amidotransferase subunit D